MLNTLAGLFMFIFVSAIAGARVTRAALVLMNSFRNRQQTTEELKVQ